MAGCQGGARAVDIHCSAACSRHHSASHTVPGLVEQSSHCSAVDNMHRNGNRTDRGHAAVGTCHSYAGSMRRNAHHNSNHHDSDWEAGEHKDRKRSIAAQSRHFSPSDRLVLAIAHESLTKRSSLSLEYHLVGFAVDANPLVHMVRCAPHGGHRANHQAHTLSAPPQVALPCALN